MEFSDVFFEFFVQVVLPILAGVFLFFSSLLLSIIKKKYNFQLSEEKEIQIKNIVIDAISYAEEWAAKEFKKKTNKLTTGNEKMDIALAYIMKEFPEANKYQVEMWVESMLGKMQGVGATGEKKINLD